MKRRIQRNLMRRALRQPHHGSSYHVHQVQFRGVPHAYGYCETCGCAMKHKPQAAQQP